MFSFLQSYPSPLEVGPLKSNYIGGLRERCKLPQPKSNLANFCALQSTSGGNNFNDLTENRLTEIRVV